MKKFFKSFVWAINGLITGLAEQRNMKVQAVIGLITIVAGWYFHIPAFEWCVVVFAIALVVGFELMNSAVENLVDLVTLEHKPLAGKIKDMAAGAVLVVSIGAGIVGILIFSKYLI